MQEEIMQKLIKDLRRRARKHRSLYWDYKMSGVSDKQWKMLVKFWREGVQR